MFASDRDGLSELYTADPDGTNASRVTTVPSWGSNQSPAWAPDGRIAFVSSREGSRWALTLMNGDGSDLHTLFPTDYQPYDDDTPAWSPDGQTILFSSTRPFYGDWELWAVESDGSNLRQLTTGGGHAPAWSPDGTKIAYEGRDPAVGNIIVVMNADGTGAHRLTSATQPETAPSWSPDGRSIAYGRYTSDWRSSNAHAIFVSDDDGGNERQVTFGAAHDAHPVFSPDGQEILFQRWPGYPNPVSLYKVRPDGSGLTTLEMPGSNSQPDWAPAVASPPVGSPPDTTPPSILISSPLDDAVYTLGALVSAHYACADENGGSGVETCAAKPPLSGDRLDTSSVGWKSFTVLSFDRAGNGSALTHRYQVVYPFAGFLSPVENPPTLNPANAGKAVPLRFSLQGDRGLGILAGAGSYPVSCQSPEPILGEAATGSLSYNRTLDRYTFLWGTEKAWVGSCRMVLLRLNDGSEHRAIFRFGR